jgi:hypothetical protein
MYARFKCVWFLNKFIFNDGLVKAMRSHMEYQQTESWSLYKKAKDESNPPCIATKQLVIIRKEGKETGQK